MDPVACSFALGERWDIATAARWCRRHPRHASAIAEMAAAMAMQAAEERGAPVRMIAAARYASDVLRAARQRR